MKFWKWSFEGAQFTQRRGGATETDRIMAEQNHNLVQRWYVDDSVPAMILSAWLRLQKNSSQPWLWFKHKSMNARINPLLIIGLVGWVVFGRPALGSPSSRDLVQ